MAVIVKGMDMPKSCKKCELCTNDICNAIDWKSNSIDLTRIHPKCPLKSVEGLIEQIRRQEFVYFTKNGGYYMTLAEIKDVVETIIKEYCGLEE